MVVALSIEDVKRLRPTVLSRAQKRIVVPIRCPLCWRIAPLWMWGWENPYVYHTAHHCDHCWFKHDRYVNIDVWWLIGSNRISILKARMCIKEGEEWNCRQLDNETIRKMIFGQSLLDYARKRGEKVAS